MRQLLLLRHAKSNWEDPSLADHDRPPSIVRADPPLPAVRETLLGMDLAPELILVSSARRTPRNA